jgi:hypothetical protein
MEVEYGPTYAGLPQTREYVQYYLSDAMLAASLLASSVRLSSRNPREQR